MEKTSTLVSIVKVIHEQSTGTFSTCNIVLQGTKANRKRDVHEVQICKRQWHFVAVYLVQSSGKETPHGPDHYSYAVGRLPMDKSWEKTKQILLMHCVQRPPFSVSIFSLADLQAITHYLLHT